jgi:DNA primase
MAEQGLHPEQVYTELPDQARAFLYKYHFTDELIKHYRICHAADFLVWSTSKGAYFNSGDRVILPYYNERNKFAFCEGRTLQKNNDLKYVTVGGKKTLFKSYRCTQTGWIVIVEDMLSAMRVGQVQACMALRGTSVNDEKLYSIIQNDDWHFCIWLDGDKPGQNAAKLLKTKLEWMGCDVLNLVTDKDPKCYSKKRIFEFLQEVSRQ